MKVAVTTTQDGFDRFALPLRECGLSPLSLPCILVTPAAADVLARVRGAARDADRIVITSARAVATLWPDGSMPATPVLAVGGATAHAVRQAGGTVAATGDGGAADLVRGAGSELAGHTIVYPHAAGADPAILEMLREAAARVMAAPVYSTQPIAPAAEPEVDAVLFASPSAVDGWRMSRPLRGVVLAAIGATTAAHIRSLHAEPAVIAPRPTPIALSRSLAAHLAERNLV